MAQQDDKIKALYDQLKNDGYQLDDENTFRQDLQDDASFREDIYNAQRNDGYDMGGDFNTWQNRLMSNFMVQGNKTKPSNTSGSHAQQVVDDYDRSVAHNNIQTQTTSQPQQPQAQKTVRQQETKPQTQPKTQFVPEASNVRGFTVAKDDPLRKQYPFLDQLGEDELAYFRTDTNQPLYAWKDSEGKDITPDEAATLNLRADIEQNDAIRPRQVPVTSLQLPTEANITGVKTDNSVTDYTDKLLRQQYGDNYLNGEFKTKDGRTVSGAELLTENAQDTYDNLNKDINTAKTDYANADEQQREEIISTLLNKYGSLVSEKAVRRTLDNYAAQQEVQIGKPTLWQTLTKSLGAGFMRAGAGLLDTMQSLTSGLYVENPSSPTGYMKTRSYEEALADKNDPMTVATGYMHNKADKLSEEAQPHSGRKGFLDMLWDGEIGGFLQKGIATTGESLPMTLSAFNPYTMTLNAISMAGSNYRENTLANPDIPAWKRAAQAVGSAAIEQAVEKYSDPIFKYVGGGKILRGASKNASEKITNDITGKAAETLAKRIYGRLKGLGKDALGEGAEEIIGNFGNDILGETLDIVDGNEDYGLRAQWKEMKKENPDADLADFSMTKAKEYVESFIGGAMAGAYTSGTAHLSTKAIQYSFDRLGNGSVEENEGKPLNPVNVDLAQSFDDGYSEEETTELQDTKNLYELRQSQMAEKLGVETEQVDDAIGDPVNFIGELQRLERNDEIQPVLDYINAKAKFDGMIQRVRDDIDGRIEQSNKMVNERTNHETGMIQGATLKVQDTDGNDRRAYILSGNLVMLPDGTGVDREKSGNSILILHEDTNEMEMVSPDAIFSIEQPVDPELEKQTAAEAIRQQFAGEAANRIDGVLPFNQGDTYTLTDENGQQSQIQIVPNQDGIVDNGDGTVNVSSDGGVTVVPMSKDDIQLMSDATNRARVLRSEQQREAERLEQAQPEYSLNTEVTLRDEAGNAVRGSITADMNEDGQYEVYTESPINGRKVNLFTADELNALNYEQPDGNNGGQNIPENGNIGQENIPQGNVAGYSVNEEAVNGITLDDFMKTDSSYVESYYAEHPESMATEIQEKAETTADYLNGNLSAHDYLAALGYATGEKSWLDNTTEEEIEQTVSDRVAAYMPFLNQPAATEAVQPDTTEVVSQPQEQLQQPQQSALERIPKDDKGEPVYEQTDADTAWDAIVEQSEGDEAMAQSVADSMLADKEAELKKVEKAKPKGGTTVAEKIAAERERKNAVEQAKATLAHWQKIAQTAERRRQVAMAEQARAAAETARLRREQEETERAEREEADRIRREALNGVPDIIDDKPQDARARGYRRVNGEKVDRQQPLQAKQGKEVQVKFDDKNIPAGRVSLIEAEQLQPSHVNGRRNPLHFIDEAQPKERNDEASVISARNIAANIRPEEITSSVTAYTGAPTVNARGEVIQGNNRSAALREMWAGQPEQAAKYKQYLAAHAADFGLTPEDVEAMQHPVLVNMIDVADDDAITLGQFVAQDTESGGVERIKPKNIVQKMGGNMRSYANLLLKSTDDEMSFAELVDRNGMDVLKWMQQKGYITSTQYKSAFDSKGNLTAEAKNDLKGIMYQSIFQNGNTHLEEMFGALPVKAQKAILATAYRDYDSPNAERMNMELQDSISAYYALSQMPEFANAKNYKEARIAAEAWKRQLALDDVTGESYLPSERYSNFAILLATMYKGQTQMFIQNTFKNIYDLVQGTQEETLFETPDNTPRTLVAAINEAINSVRSELLINEQFTYNNGQRRNNVLAGSGTTGQPRGQGSPGSPQAGGRIEDGTGTATDKGGVVPNDDERGGQGDLRHSSGRQQDNLPQEAVSEKVKFSDEVDENGRQFVLTPEGELEFGVIDDKSGLTPAPILLSEGLITNPATNDGYGLVHIEARHGDQIRKAGYKSVLDFIEQVAKNYERIKEGSIRRGHQTYMLQLKDKHNNTLMVELSSDGNYWNINTAGIFKETYGKNRKEVYSRHTTAKQSAETVEASQEVEQSGTQTSSSMNAPASLKSQEVSLHPNTQVEESVPLNETNRPTITDNQPALLGINSSDFSNGKDTEKSLVTQTIGEKVAQAEAETEQNPTDGQKEAGNYKKGHVRIGQFDITVENPKGSVRRGTDANGKPWETTMQNTYGYIRGTEGVDGDHIDVFLSDDIDGWNGRRVYVVDQYNEDGTFDEHKVMLGFNDEDDARNAYLSNYSEDWANNRKIVITSTNLEDFEKWINSSHRKTKPFAEYKSVPAGETKAISPADRIAEIDEKMTDLKKQADEAHKRSDIFEEARLISESNELYAERRRLMQEIQSSQAEEESNEQPQEQQGQTDDRYTVEQRYHKKKDTYIYAVKFTEQMPREQFLSLKKRVKDFGGYYSSYGKGGFIFETEEAGRKFAEAVLDPSGEKLDDNKPLSLADMQQSSEPVVHQVDVEGLMQAINENGEAKLSDHFVVGRPSLTEKATSQQTETQTQETEQQPQQSDNNGYGANNKLVSRDRYEELKKRMRQKLGGQMNMGIDPEILAIGTEMAAYHIEAGARKFADYARHMIDDLGDAIRPYLKSFYNGVRDLPEVQEAGYVDEMTPYDEVRTFDVANFDKGQGNAMATAEMVVAEQEANRQADAAKEQLTNQRNEQRRQEDEQRTADTEAVADEAETTASEAESRIEAATDEKEVNEAVRKVDEQLDKVNRQLALLGYYEAEPVESDFNEAYGYMRNAEKKAVKDANNLANRLVKDIGIDPKTIVDKTGKRRRSIATANIAPIGGDISIHLPLGEKRELYISIQLDNQDGDNLKVTGGMLRIENPNPERGEERYLSFNNFFAEDETYPSLLRMVQQLVKRYAPDFVPVSNAQQEASTKSGKKSAKRQKKQDESKIADLFSGQEETVSENQEDMPFKKGDNVIYNGKPATVYDIEKNGRLVLDTGLAPVLYESADPKEVKPANTATHNAENTEINRIFANAVKTDMLAALDSGAKPYRSILDLRKRAAALGMEVDNDGRTDILLQELVEDGLVRAAREVVEQHGRDSRESYDLICKLYEMQPTIAARSSNRIKMQQYSTPLPMAWNATRFAMIGKKDGKVLEPTAGNGMLVFAVPANQVYVNELDETRLDNLREQGFAQVTQQDATEPFEGGQQYDVIIANPPFGKRDEVEYDGKMIPGLDPQITLNALASMKDNGKAAIIIGGNMEYGNNGGLKSMKPFFTYLYDHYNVKGVVDMDGKLYSKQGTTFPTRMILIAGRRSNEERAQTAVYPPIESKAIRKADSFDDLYDIIDEVINSKEKTNGTEILRSQQGQLVSVADQPSRNADGKRHTEQSRKDDTGRPGGRTSVEGTQEQGEVVLRREHRTDTGNGEARRGAGGNTEGGSRRVSEPDVQRVERVGVSTERVGLEPQRTAEQPKKRGLSEEKLPYRPHNTAFSLQSVAPAAMVEAMDRTLSQIEKKHGNIDEFVRKELGYDTTDELHQALAAEQIDSVAMAIYQMKQGQALIIGDQTGVGKGRQMAALIRWAVKRGEKPIFITQKADLFSDIYRDLVDIGSGDLVPFIFNSDGAMVDSNGNTVHKPLSSKEMAKVFAAGQLPDEYDFAVLTYSQVNTGDEVSQKEAEEAAKKRGGRTKKSKASKDGKATPKATFLRAIAEDNYLFLDESHTAAGTSNTGAYLQSILRSAKAATFASATFAKRPDTMPLYAIRTAMSQAKVEPDKLIGIIEKGGVTLQEIMSRELTNAGQMVRRERDMSDVVTDWKTINDPATVKRARENYDRTIAAFNAIIKFQEDYVKPMVDAMDKELAIMAESAGIKRGTDKMGVENVPFASKTYNYTKQLMLALKVDAIANEVDAEIKAGRHPVIALESTMESSIKDYSAGEVISEPTFSASLLRGLDTVMQYTIKDENGKEQHARYTPKQLGEAGEKAYYELQDFIRKSTSDIFISPLDAIIERLHEMGYKVGELTGRNMYVERDDDGRVVVRRRTDKDKKRMQREFNSGELDVLILNKSASTGISLHASEKFSDQRQRTMIIAQPLSDINDYMQMIGRIDRTGQVHRGYYINLGLPVPAENRFLMMLSTKLKSLNANTTTSQDSESNDVEAPDLLNKYGSQVVVEYLRDNPEIYEKMGGPLKKAGQGGGRVQTNELDAYKPQEDDARKITGYVALLTTKEQEEFYDDVVRRYNELIKYLNDTGNNDLKITVMPLRAKTLNKRVSSEGIDPTGTNPFARNSYVEQVEMDVLRKPMKAAEIRKTIEQVNKGKRPEDYIRQVIATIEKEDEVRIAAEEARYERSKAKVQEDIAKQTEKINRQQKRTAEEKQAAIADYVRETNDNVETKHNDNMVRLNTNSDMLKQRLHMFEVGKSYLMPDNLESMVFDFSTPAIFCGYKAKDSKITASTTLAVFATLDGRRRMEIKLSQPEALRSIYKTTNDNWDAARSTTLENWDSQIPTGTRKTGFIMTGNILQAIADTQDEHGGYPGQLISYTDIDGNVHDGILMPDKWNTSMLKTSGAPIISRLKQIKDYMPVTSHDGKVDITGSSWAKVYYLTVPKTKKDGAVYYENKVLLRAVNGSNFYPYRGKLRADIPEKNIERVVRELSKLGVKVKEESDEGDVLYRNGDEGLKKVNERFNEKLNGLTEANADKVVLSLGRPSDILRAAGVEDKPMKLYGNKVMKKMRKHGFTLDELHDLPQAVAEPIAVFKNYGKDGNRSILTELKTEQGNFLVTLTLGEGHDVDFNIVTSVFGKGESNIIDWIKRGFATYINKGKALNYLHHSALKAVTSDNQELISAANIVRNFENPSVEKENLCDGNGALSDDDLSVANDPVSKLLGKSTRTTAQRRAFAERERQRMTQRVQELAEKLHLDNVDIVTDASTLQGRRAKAKGFYSRSTGRITIVIPNHASVYDAEQTLLHEAVAHYGLRQLFGEHFDTFLDNVFQNAEKGIQERIAQIEERLYQADIEERTKRKGGGVFARAEAVTEANTKRRNGDYRKAATEEYLASLAENTNFDNTDASWWQKIKELFLRMLHKIGFENFSGVTLSDNELRYILWRSYENLAEPGRYRSILGEAEDVAKQNELKVGNYAPANETETSNAAENSKNADSGEDLFRDNEDDASAIYEKGVADTFWHRLSEGWYDYLRSVRVLQDALQNAMGRKLDDFENVLLNALHKTSVDKAQWDSLKKRYIDPLANSLAKVVDGKKTFRGKKLTQDDVEIYLNCKHGLERNDKFAMRDAEQMRDERIKKADDELSKAERDARNAMERAIRRADKQLHDGEIDNVKYDQLINDAKDEYDESIAEANDAHEKAVKKAENNVTKDYQKNRKRDYSGLTEIFDPEGEAGYTNAELEDMARQYVADMEQVVPEQELNDLWDKIHKINAYSLKKSYESGLISKQTYESTKNMFDYYVPLRGFNKETANDVYDYITESNIPIEQVMKHAGGRTSRATYLIATMMNMAHSSIVSGNRNLVKQKLLNLALNADNDLLTVGNQWYEDDGMGGWIPVQEPPIRDGMTAKEAREVVEQFEENMKEREKNGEVRRMRKGVSLPVRIVGKRAENEHGVRVKRNGQEYVVWINGNPKAAQAINGILNPETERGWVLDHIHKLNRFVSKNVTSLRPNFLLSNLKRDILSSNMVGFVKYGIKYTRMFDKFVKDNLSIVDVKGAKAGKMRGIYALYHRYNNGTLDLNDKRDRYFKEFMENGGETGYSQMWSIDDYEKQIRRTLNKDTAKEKFRNGWQAVGDAVEFANRGIENVCRFAAYMASRESGMSVLQSIADAKEASVNFNRKGSGAMGNNAARAMFMFLNPAIQGFMQHNKLLMKYPKRMLAIDGGLIALGVIVGLVNSLIWGGGDDDDDKETENDYFNINPFVRRNNIVLRVGRHEYAKIDLPQELRPWYGLGEIAYAAMTGHMKHDNVGVELFSQLTQTIPLNPITGNTILDPNESLGVGIIRNLTGATSLGSITDAYLFDKDYAGNKITKASEYNKLDPEWKRAGRGTSSLMIGTTRMLNDLTGGNDYKKGFIDLNPSRLEHVATSMLGGRVEFFKQLWTTGQALVSGDEDERNNMRNYPFVSTSYINTDNSYNRNYRLNNEFDWYQHEFEQARHEYNGLKNDKKNVFEKAEEFDAFIQTPEYKIYRRFKKYDRLLKKQLEKLSDETDDDKRKEINDKITEIKKDAVEEMQRISK